MKRKRNGAAYLMEASRHGRHTLETNGRDVRGGKRKGRMGKAGGGRVKRN